MWKKNFSCERAIVISAAKKINKLPRNHHTPFMKWLPVCEICVSILLSSGSFGSGHRKDSLHLDYVHLDLQILCRDPPLCAEWGLQLERRTYLWCHPNCEILTPERLTWCHPYGLLLVPKCRPPHSPRSFWSNLHLKRECCKPGLPVAGLSSVLFSTPNWLVWKESVVLLSMVSSIF